MVWKLASLYQSCLEYLLKTLLCSLLDSLCTVRLTHHRPHITSDRTGVCLEGHRESVPVYLSFFVSSSFCLSFCLSVCLCLLLFVSVQFISRWHWCPNCQDTHPARKADNSIFVCVCVCVRVCEKGQHVCDVCDVTLTECTSEVQNKVSESSFTAYYEIIQFREFCNSMSRYTKSKSSTNCCGSLKHYLCCLTQHVRC